MDVLTRHRAEVFIAGVLVDAFPHPLPANLVIKLAYLFLDFEIVHSDD
jgi:hypothetical protein